MESRDLLAALADGELDAATAARLRAHLETCPACAAAHAGLLRLRACVRTHASRHRAPPHLRQQILAALPRPPRPQPRRTWAALPWSWINFGAAGAFAAAFAVTLALHLAAPVDSERLQRDIVASHFRSLMAEHLTDVASSDRHTVKPWFSGKLDFAPPVFDLAPQGYALIGGRLDYVDGRSVAALAYRHHKHVLNVFVWPDRGGADAAPRLSSRQGYQLETWSAAGLRYWAVSDMSGAELEEFQRTLAARNAAG